MANKKRASDDAKEEFQKIKKSLPRGWILLHLKKYGKKNEAEGYRKGMILENIRDGTTAPTNKEINEFLTLIPTKI